MDIEIFKQLGVALALSLLVGLEREHKFQLAGDEDNFGGVRTFTLMGLAGAMSYLLLDVSVIFSAGIILAFVALLVSSYVMASRDPDNIGLTSEIAAVLVFGIGILSAMEQFLLATVIALVLATTLHFKKRLHNWAKGLKNYEIVSVIQFVLITFVVLPLLPDQAFGPYGFFNPYKAWLMVVLISALSYMSYFAVKLWGAKRGIGITGFLAGFVSSTALALSFSGQSRGNKSVVNPYVVAVIVASSAMFFRVLVEVALVNRELLDSVLIPMLAMGTTGVLGAIFFWLKKDKTPKGIEKQLDELESPISIVPAIKFGAFFVGISFLAKFASDFFGDAGIYITSLLSGILDVDAITLSMADLAKSGTITNRTALIAITLATMTNTLVKAGIFLALGSRKVAVRILAVMTLVVIVGAVSLFVSLG